MPNRKTWVKFSEEDDQKLIDLVRQNPDIYQMRGRDYKSSVIKFNIWKKISQELGRSVDECKMKWKTIRDYYCRKKKTYSTSGMTTAKDDIRFQQLSFLDTVASNSSNNDDPLYDLQTQQEQQIVWNVIPDASIEGEIAQDQNSFSCETQQEQEIEQKAKRRCSRPVKDNNSTVVHNETNKEQTERTSLLRELTKHLQDQSSVDECDPALAMFFKSIAATVSTFSPLLKAKIKLEMMNLVSRYEIEHVKSTTTNSNGHLTDGHD